MSIAVMTEKGLFGRKHTFTNGLNILRANNSRGKSTVIRSLMYALGLEGMFSPSQDIPLPHVLTEYIDLPEGNALVKESSVTVEIINAAGKVLTVSRAIVGTKDRHLIEVREGSGLSDPKNAGVSQDYFVRTPRGATSARGFHYKLAEFIGWEIPEVSNFDGGSVPLYLETIFPLLSVEQKLGWGRIPARFPSWLGIKDVRRRTVEFLLNLDAYAIAEEKLAIQQAMNRVRVTWSETRTQAGKRATAAGALLNAIPQEPVSKWPPEIVPQIYIGSEKSSWEAISAHLEKLKERQSALRKAPIPKAGDDDTQIRTRLADVEGGISQRELLLRQTLQNLEGEISEADALEESILSLVEDQRKYKDIRKLRELGSETVLETIDSVCPTCHQEISDSLMDLGQRASTMSVDQNIAFYNEQLQLSEAVLKNARNSITASEAEIASIRGDLDRLRSEVRSLRETLSSPAQTPSIEALTDRLRLDQRIENLEGLVASFQDSMGIFANLSDDWNILLDRLKKLPKGVLSQSDEAKRKDLERSIQEQLQSYGFGSVGSDLITVSKDYYEPELSDMNLAADAAASDVIRLQWAYLLGLAEVSNRLGGNHPKFLVMDEPQQQSVEDKDFFQMMRHASTLKDTQIIIGTSHEKGSIGSFVASTEGVNLWELNDEHLIVRIG
jgi:hypothetical protein